jgi:hypothetical protein
MATLYTNYAAVQLAPTPITMLQPLEATPTTRVVQPVYTFTGAEAAADVIRVFQVPAGSIVIPHLSNVVSDAVATTATITVGDDGLGSTLDADRYSTALNVAAAGVDAFTGGAAATVPYQSTAEGWITVTLATLATPVAGKKLFFNLALNQVS